MKAGLIGDTRYVIDNAGHFRDIYSFTIAAERPSFYRIFDSAFATPARYIQEIFTRLRALEGPADQPDRIAVFNPLFDSGPLVLMQAAGMLRRKIPPRQITILTDRKGVPAAYLFPAWLGQADAHYLTLLSAIDGEIDARLCRLLFQVEAQCIALPGISLARSLNNGFIYKSNSDIFKWISERAIALLQAQPGTPRTAIPFTAIMPHHAGDALFFTMAMKGTDSHISRIAVNRAYRDIVDDSATGLTVVPIDMPVINRNDDFKQGKVATEASYFESISAALPRDSFYNWCRPSRDYNATLFHLTDHFAFALGRHFYSERDLISRMPAALRRATAPQRTAAAPSRQRVLLHFDGGWTLKVYPKSLQERLIDLLLARGYEVTVLAGDAAAHPKCEVTNFKSLSQFKALLQDHDLIVGMDSFPAHYAAHVDGCPTICLFASTRPENSDAPAAPNYRLLEHGLSCRPCYGIVRCPLYGKSSCRNFVDPEIVADEVQRMLQAARHPAFMLRPAPEGKPRDTFAHGSEDMPTDVRMLSLRYLRFKVIYGFTVLPSLRYIGFLRKEYVATMSDKGFLFAHFLALRFLFRKARAIFGNG